MHKANRPVGDVRSLKAGSTLESLSYTAHDFYLIPARWKDMKRGSRTSSKRPWSGPSIVPHIVCGIDFVRITVEPLAIDLIAEVALDQVMIVSLIDQVSEGFRNSAVHYLGSCITDCGNSYPH